VSPVERKTLEDYLIVKKPKKPTDAWEIFQRFLKRNKLIVKKSALLKS
jgi:IS1 family transposase